MTDHTIPATDYATAQPPAIFPAMLAVLRDVEAVGKNRANQTQGYKFRSIDDVLNAIHPSLAKAGVFLAPEVTDRQIERTEKEGKTGGMQTTWHVHLTVRHRFYAVDGSSVDVTTIGSAMDSGDKASNKAMSAALKYALIEAFAIPLEDMDEGDEDRGPRRGAGPETRQQAAAHREPAATQQPAPVPWTKDQLDDWTVWKTKITALVGGPERFKATNGSLKASGATYADYMAHFEALYEELAKDQPPH
jgi:hypothetical protein